MKEDDSGCLWCLSWVIPAGLVLYVVVLALNRSNGIPTLTLDLSDKESVLLHVLLEPWDIPNPWYEGCFTAKKTPLVVDLGGNIKVVVYMTEYNNYKYHSKNGVVYNKPTMIYYYTNNEGIRFQCTDLDGLKIFHHDDNPDDEVTWSHGKEGVNYTGALEKIHQQIDSFVKTKDNIPQGDN